MANSFSSGFAAGTDFHRMRNERESVKLGQSRLAFDQKKLEEEERRKKLEGITTATKEAITGSIKTIDEFKKQFQESDVPRKEYTGMVNTFFDDLLKTYDVQVQAHPELVDYLPPRKTLEQGRTAYLSAPSFSELTAAKATQAGETTKKQTESRVGAEKDMVTYQDLKNPANTKTIMKSDPNFDALHEQYTSQGLTPVNRPGLQMTGTPKELGLTTSETGKIQERIVATRDSLANLKRIRQSFKPEYLKLPTQISVSALQMYEKAGVFGDLSPENQAKVKAVAEFRQNAFEAINSVIRQITGAQMSEKEATRIRKQVPDPENDGPTAYQAKLDQAIEIAQLADARYTYLLKNGFTEDELSKNFSDPDYVAPVTIDQMEGILDARVDELRSMGRSDDQIRTVMKQEFGL